MLIETAQLTIMRDALQRLDRLNKASPKVAKFEELCSVLREQGSVFLAKIDVQEFAIVYSIIPENYGDHLAIVEALSAMGAHRTPGEVYDLINPEPDAPLFLLSVIPTKGELNG
ncbi:MAG: hypothetical protein WC825_02320 [Gallionellaceae bacterium]|jgi:hypothetical protein